MKFKDVSIEEVRSTKPSDADGNPSDHYRKDLSSFLELIRQAKDEIEAKGLKGIKQ